VGFRWFGAIASRVKHTVFHSLAGGPTVRKQPAPRPWKRSRHGNRPLWKSCPCAVWTNRNRASGRPGFESVPPRLKSVHGPVLNPVSAFIRSRHRVCFGSPDLPVKSKKLEQSGRSRLSGKGLRVPLRPSIENTISKTGMRYAKRLSQRLTRVAPKQPN